MADIRITPASSIMSFTSSLNFTEKLTQDASGSLNLYGSGSTGRTELLSIDGNNGRLFTVSDDLSDSLFSVNTIAGLPVIEAFADNKVVLGQYGQNDLIITSDNKVCIGTATETDYKLNVVNSLGIGTSTTQYHGMFLTGNGANPIAFYFEDTQYGEIKFGEEGNVITGYQSPLNIYTGTNLNINLMPGGAGSVGLGTTSPAVVSGYKTLTLDSTTGTFTEYRQNGTALMRVGVDGARPFFYGMTNATMEFYTNTTSRMKLTGGGALGLGVTPTNTAGRFEASNDIVAYSSSDKRWKTNIKNIDSPLEKISQISGVEFDWIEDEPVHGNKGHDIGVIAQEIEQILPEAVQTRESGMKAVKYEKIIPLVIEAMKEQQKQIEELKQIINGLTK